ncbi:regulatory-associated protein of TOR 1-like isoform X2 [Humulus lupulus]|nr:regulatory-associated protein of TOR 1-like isoform X2 [Humulus lupulus]
MALIIYELKKRALKSSDCLAASLSIKALSVGIFPYVLKLLQTTTPELQQILVFIWMKVLALDKSCQVDLVKDGGHTYFIRFLDSQEAYPEQRAMAAFILAGQEACIESVMKTRTECVGFARIGSEDQIIVAGTMKQLQLHVFSYQIVL